MSKMTHEFFVERFYAMHEPGEYTVLSEFVKSSESVLIRHNKCGKEYYAMPSNLYMGKGCKSCCIPKKSQDVFLLQLYNVWGNEYTPLEQYNGSSAKILVRHNKCGTEYKTTPDSLLHQHGCAECAGLRKKTTAEVTCEINQVGNGSYELKSAYEKNNGLINILHKTCDTVFATTYTNFITHGSRCPLCNANYTRTKELFAKEFYVLAGDDYALLSDYEGSNARISVRHNVCGHEYTVLACSFIKGSRCPECAHSKGEDAVKKYLKTHEITHKAEYTIPECKDKQVLPFDFAIFKGGRLNCLIEYQGEQHYKSLARFGWNEKFADRQRKDNIKRKYCSDNGIKLIEIPYTVKNIDEFLNKELSA